MRRFALVVLFLAIAAGGWWWFAGRTPDMARAESRRGAETVPVVTAPVTTRDVPVWLDGLGTVQASATVTVRSQVDGTLLEVRFREGQDVRTGDVLAKIDPRTYQAALDQAVAKRAQDQASLSNARADAARYGKLAANAYTSAQQVDAARAQVGQFEAQVAQDAAAIDQARINLDHTTITAPIDGRVGLRTVDAGNVVHAADATGLATITTLRPIAVLFTLPQQALPAVAAAMARGAAEVQALADAAAVGAPVDTGTLAVLDNQVDPGTGTIKLKALFPNAGLALWPGAFVPVRLRADTVRAAVTVPPAAVQRGPQGTYVYVAADGKAVRRPVRVSHEDRTVSVVAEGLTAGDRVVVDGAARLSDGARIGAAGDIPVRKTGT